MRGTRIGMPRAPGPSATAPVAAASRADLDRLDDALAHVRRLLQRPGYRRHFQAALPTPVDLTTLRVLRAVERMDDAPSIREVAEVLGVDPSSASRFVDQAVGGGYLDRRTCERDRRRSRLHLTGSGRDLLAVATRARRTLLAEVTGEWSADDVVALGALLERLRSDLDRFETSP